MNFQNRTFGIVLTLILFVGCTQKVDTEIVPPENLISQEEMVDIVVDLLILDAILLTKQKKKSRDLDQTKYYLHNSILVKYDITRESFEASFNYYAQNLEVMDKIFEEAIIRLSKQQSELDSE
jgi:hypothetical protein